jgi:[acyl-carrier-protein] S-malonyltransferase
MADPGKVAWVFPGQGSQRVGMGRGLAEGDPEIAALLAEANDILGFDLTRIIFEGPEDALQQTPVQQPAILLTSLAYLRALQSHDLLPQAEFVAGHSLGEYAALVAAGALEFPAALRLVRRRGELMQEHGGGGMAAIIGLAPGEVAAIAREAGAEVANFNAPDQTTVSGPAEAVRAAVDLAKTRGAKRAIPLPVSAAFHSSLMAPAAVGMAPLLDAVQMRPACLPLVANVDGRLLVEADDLRRELREQICGVVRWVDGVETLRQHGVATFYEIGPGKVLAGLIGRCAPAARVVTADRILVDAGVPV